jgi:predicted PurR-regulated permease PerM
MFKKSQPAIKPTVIIGLLVITIIAGYWLLQDYITLIIVAIILAFLFNPFYGWALKKFNNKKGLAVTLTVLLLFATITIPVTVILAITVNQALEIVDIIKNSAYDSASLQETLANIVSTVNKQIKSVPGIENDVLSVEQITDTLKNSAQAILVATVDFVKAFSGGIASFFTNLIIFLFVFSSILKNQKKILETIESINPLGQKASQAYLQKMGDMTTAMVKGQFIIAIAQGLSGVLSLWIIGVDFLAFWFVILTFLSIIPLGGGIILIPFGIVLILTGNVWQGVVLLAWHFIITTNIDNILRPKFVPKNAKLDPALTILSVFGGLSLFGFLGIIIGPVIMILIVTTIQAYVNYKNTGKIYIESEATQPKKDSLFKRLSAKISVRKSKQDSKQL